MGKLEQHFGSCLGDDPEWQYTFTKEYFRRAIAGDVEAAESLAYCLKKNCAIVVTWFSARYRDGYIPCAVFGAVLRTTYTDGKIFGGFRDCSIPTREVVGMFTAAGPAVMRDEDRETLRRLPSQFRVYRGTIGTSRQALWSFSWTTQEDVAATFAALHHEYDNKHRPGVVFTGTVSKIDVLAYFSDRQESEVIVRPCKVRGIRLAASPAGVAQAEPESYLGNPG